MSRSWGPLRELLFERDGYRCAYCGGIFPVDELVPDHVHPVCRGGPSSADNLFTACRACNQTKLGRTLEHFRDLMMRRRDGRPNFTAAQIDYLARFGIEIPRGEPYVFWFEREEEA